MGILYIVATPIGNLGDITKRALEIFKEVDFVLAEDTRVTKKLLLHYDISTPLISYHQHSGVEKYEEVYEFLSQGKNLALVTDAGTPGISDPGNELVAFLLKKNPEIKIIPLPGSSALTVLASIAGISMDKFLFLGYPPHKKGRTKFFKEVAESKHPVIFYESPYRIAKSLEELGLLDEDFYLIVGRELTKKFETVYRGKIKEIIEILKKSKPKGEFVVVLYQER